MALMSATPVALNCAYLPRAGYDNGLVCFDTLWLEEAFTLVW